MVASPAAAFAQTSLQIPLQFDFLNPGAKSLALAGAVGLTFACHLEFNAAFDAASTTKIFSSSLIVR
jgi:hypothetical protein